MHHLLTVAALLAMATLATGLVLPLTTRHRPKPHAQCPGGDRDQHDEVAAAELATCS